MAEPKRSRLTVSDPVFVVRLVNGLANRNRLPLDQVIRTLDEVRQMLTETGKALLLERGQEAASVDFGLELVADGQGVAFRRGSVQASIAITRNVEIGVRAAGRVLATVRSLAAVPAKPANSVAPVGRIEAKVVNRLEKLAFLHEKSRAEAEFQIRASRSILKDLELSPSQAKATFDKTALESVRQLGAAEFVEHGVNLYGKLIELKDSGRGDADGKYFLGELRRDNGDVWRVQIDNKWERKVAALFRRQVHVRGTAYYYRSRLPKLVADGVDADPERDYLAAFDELFGCDREAFAGDTEEMIETIRGSR